MPERHFGNRSPAGLDHLCQQILVLGRIDLVVTAGAIPRANPDAMTKPAPPRSRAREPANLRPAPEALREPTMAIIGRISTSCAPRTPSRGGASSSTAR